jgi:hypothetical protein
MQFVEKQIIGVKIAEAYMDGAAGIPYSCCEVYAPSEIITNVSFDVNELALVDSIRSTAHSLAMLSSP